MKVEEIRQLSVSDAHKKLAELRGKVQELKFSIANNQLGNIRDLRKIKKDIAKIMTVLNETGNEDVKPKLEVVK